MLNVWTNINNWFNDSTKGIRQFFLDNTRNPFLWVGLRILPDRRFRHRRYRPATGTQTLSFL